MRASISLPARSSHYSVIQIGPDQPAAAQFNPTGNVTATLAGMQVLVNGLPAPLLYAAPGQVNFIAPFATLPPWTRLRCSTSSAPE